MIDTCITITRNQLYERVWTVPIKTLAVEFGISDVRLGKICRKHNIPLPGRGYWAKVKAGKTIRRKELPLPADNAVIRSLPIVTEPEGINDPHVHERIQQLEQQISTWYRCDTIRAYLREVEKAATKKFGKIEKGSTMDKWLRWGYGYADSLDPTSKVIDWFATRSWEAVLDSNPIVRTVKKM